jgi:hypothetical protein
MRSGLVAALFGLAVLGIAAGCRREPIRLIDSPPDGSSPAVDGGAPASSCPWALADRVKVIPVPVGKSIAWQKPGYDHFPVDERVALAAGTNGQAYIAWGEVNATGDGPLSSPSPLGVHVTPLDSNFSRRGDDVILPTAQEVSGLVAHEDGFAVLVRDNNRGTKIDLGDAGDAATLAFLVRYKNGEQAWRYPLTGSLSDDAPEAQTVYSPFLEGQLVWNDLTYGAYFSVRGGSNDASPGFWRDALMFRNSFGNAFGQAAPPPWTVVHGCTNNGGLRLIADSNKTNLSTLASIPQMTGLCVQQSRQTVKFTSLEADRLVSDQEVQWLGYAGAKLGSLLKTDDGYLVFWLSLGSSNDHQGHDIRMARLDSGFNLVGGPTWVLPRTPNLEEWNLHVAPYGKDRFLMMYNEINITGPAADSDWAMYLGGFLGTRLRIMAADGATIMEALVPSAPTTANAEPVVLPGGDVAWPFVNPSPDYAQRIYDPNGPGQTSLHIARVCYRQ